MARSLQDAVCASLASGHHSLESHAGCYEAFGNVKLFAVHGEIVFCVCNYSVKKLDEMLACGLGSILEDTLRRYDVFASYKVEDYLDLARGDADKFK